VKTAGLVSRTLVPNFSFFPAGGEDKVEAKVTNFTVQVVGRIVSDLPAFMGYRLEISTRQLPDWSNVAVRINIFAKDTKSEFTLKKALTFAAATLQLDLMNFHKVAAFTSILTHSSSSMQSNASTQGVYDAIISKALKESKLAEYSIIDRVGIVNGLLIDDQVQLDLKTGIAVRHEEDSTNLCTSMNTSRRRGSYASKSAPHT
jgi:hypothetical protein